MLLAHLRRLELPSYTPSQWAIQGQRKRRKSIPSAVSPLHAPLCYALMLQKTPICSRMMAEVGVRAKKRWPLQAVSCLIAAPPSTECIAPGPFFLCPQHTMVGPRLELPPSKPEALWLWWQCHCCNAIAVVPTQAHSS